MIIMKVTRCTLQKSSSGMTGPTRARLTGTGLSAYFKNVDKKLARLILDEIMDNGPQVHFTDIGKSLISYIHS